ncbi:CDP-4-dehydro-6-deoxy-D-glucose 3-dehydratase [Oleiphilus sp. HI0071]|nr:CDP-4-dehydro-6-deoxy-D-glucose 3-dehydratase [Oleiphilus sp. HI0065]KZY83594.1 CDP-4-dehydro-6-deoxy-D-glucose 3-dehydratase [Oleiphilus sp. HI0071]KZY97905.1 CDP-4-dehydro-6-deoxy-D-glucose 3-dehydratase [Oleiphilus sp. HI0073]KZZ19968.1 CDP-4-dehydro-6-deoxy-D-glucose 3-dehydratase [Oleiphilus sp. HI0080]KZZ45018.1 CDP-4-dehydro-6-deoxy-D-glucose 3-dehydratase [Oleiphilus sp. HI0118]KZZ52325.1 CDP-4-dehydro-6-deoxy-D-glucose 3-dehydratase [Oleiphilus sp. HI0122]
MTTENKNLSHQDREYQILDTRIGELTFENNYLVGVPTEQSRNKIFDAIDFQRACQAYIWSVPMTSFYAWKQSLYDMGGEDGQIHYFESYDSKLGGLTYNTSTPYVISFFDVSKQPTMITIPTNEVRGAVHNVWQIGLSQMTEPGQYLIIPEGSETPTSLPEGVKVVESNSNYVFFGVRLMAKSAKQRAQDLDDLTITGLDGKPLSDKGINRPELGVDGKQPRGMAFWSILNEAIQSEPVHERDRMMHDMLRPLGIEKDKPFNPSERQKALLEEAIVVGEIMAKNIDFSKTGRLDQSEYGPENNRWEIATASTPDQNRAYGMDLDGRAAWFYEAVTNDIAMHGMANGGWGQVYLDNYRDENGKGLDGGKHYTLTVRGDVNYAETFWTVTVYNIENRAIINNKMKRADVGSNIAGTQKNEDGNYVFHFAPEKPEGVAAANWVQTNLGEGWFVYFRAYSPSKEFVAQTPETILPNFVLVE